ncbi:MULTISPECIES: hypothetical protein [unclassified Cryobacterium]|nr:MULTISPECIES: hypothetical protein [unclassified Cryobacterium]
MARFLKDLLRAAAAAPEKDMTHPPVVLGVQGADWIGNSDAVP